MKIQGITVQLGADMNGVQSALAKTNSSLKSTQSELKQVERQLKFDPTNVELLTQKQTLLSREIEQTRGKLDSYNKMLEAHNKKMEEADEVTEEMEAEHRALVREIEKTESQLKSYNKEQDKVDKSLSPLGKLKGAYSDVKDKVEELKDKHSTLIKVLDKTSEAAKKVGSVGFAALKGAATGAVAGIAALGTAGVAVGKKMAEMADHAAEVGDNIEKSAQKIGFSNEAYQKWDYVMNLAGTSMADCTNGMKTLMNQVGQAQKGTEGSVDAFKKLGLSMKDLNGMSREQTFEAVVKAMQGMEDSTERAALANQLFGKSGQNLTPLFNQNAAETKKLMDNMDELGMIMSDDAVNASAKYQDSLTTLTTTFEGIKNGIMSEMLPGMSMFMDGITGMLTGDDSAADKIMKGADDMIASLDKIIPKFSKIIFKFVDVAIEVAPKIIVSLVEGIIGHLDELLAGALTIVTTLAEGLLTEDNLTKIMKSAVNLLTNLVTFLSDNVDLIVDSAFCIIDTLVDSLLDGDNLQKLIQTSLDIVVKLATGIIDHLPELVKSAAQLAIGLADTLLNYDWWGVVKKIWNSLTGGIKKLFTSGGGGSDDVDGSHANGLPYVPFDGYRAELHKGERVLTAAETRDYDSLMSLFSQPAPVQETPAELYVISARLDALERSMPQAFKEAVKELSFTFNNRELGRVVSAL